MRKTITTIIISFLIGFSFSWGLPAMAASNAGSSADPLVAKSWADDYIQQQFSSIRSQLEEIKAYLAQQKKEIVIYINDTAYTVNGQKYTMDTRPYINDNWRTMVPVRFVAEALGCQVEYSADANGRSEKVYINGTSQIVLNINSTVYTVDGKSMTMDTAPVVNSDWRTMVPVRFVAEGLGCQVDYSKDAAGHTVSVSISK